jgi:outer membrane protein OmpA-like peptidoglycan-associated protein
MNRFLIPLLILLGSFLFSWFWNCVRRPHCQVQEPVAIEQVTANVVADSSNLSLAEDTTTIKPASVEEQLLFEPLDVYFKSGQSSISRNTEIDNWLATAKKYLAKNPGEKLSVTGHTDSDGSDATNQPLSLSRAEKIKAILIDEGFSSQNLETFGKGESEPIAENDTPENKAKNRRVSIRLIK